MHPVRGTDSLLLAWFALVGLGLGAGAGLFSMRPAEGAAGRGGIGLALENQLPVSGPRVVLTQPQGFHYHPGAAFLLQGEVRIGGRPFRGGIRVREGDPVWGPRYGMKQDFPAGTPLTFRFPVRAPAGGALLHFTIWKEDAASGLRRDVFRARLVNRLRVVPQRARVVLQCGRFRLPPRPGWLVSTLPGSAMPEAAWMYDNVDLVVVGKGSFERITAAALDTLRRWVLGGGRILITREALNEQAIRAGLTPLPVDLAGLPENPARYLDAAGLSEEDVERDARGQMIFARYRLGLGGGVFFFRWASPNAMRAVWGKAVSSPTLRRERPGRPDLRVWEQPYAFFASGAVAPERRRKTALWALLGVLMLFAGLAFGRTQGRGLLAAGWALGTIGFFAAFLARTFPAPELVASRAEFWEIAPDGRAARHTEWALLEGLRDVSRLTVRGPEDGILRPLHANQREQNFADMDLKDENGLAQRFRPRFPPPPAPLFQAVRVEERPAGGNTVSRERFQMNSPSEKLRLRAPPGAWLQHLKKRFGRWPRGAVLVRAGGSRRRLLLSWEKKAGKGEDGAGFRSVPFEGARAAVRAVNAGLGGAQTEARAEALDWVLGRAAEQNRDVLVLFDEARNPPGDQAPVPLLIRIEGVRSETGPRFVLGVMDVQM